MAHDPRNDNARVKRDITKLTINPALSHGSYGRAVGATSISFVSQAGLASGAVERDGLAKRLMAVKGNRTIKKAHRVHNAYLPLMQTDAQTCQVRADGLLLTCEPASELPDGAALLFVLMLPLGVRPSAAQRPTPS